MSPDGFDHRNVLATSQFSRGVREKWVSWFATKKYLIFLELARKIILLSLQISSYGYTSSPPPYCPRKSHWCVRQNSFGVPNRPMSEIMETQQKMEEYPEVSQTPRGGHNTYPRDLAEPTGGGWARRCAPGWLVLENWVMSEKNRHLTEYLVYAGTILPRHFPEVTNVFPRNNKRAEAPWSLCPRKFDPVREKY